MKRVLYILGVLIVSLLLVGGMLVAALTSDRVETAAVHLASKELSSALGTTASVGSVEYRFPARLAIRDIYLEDLQHDTLAYIGLLYAHFSPMSLRHEEIRFRHARMEDVVVNVYKVEGANKSEDEWNYAFLLPLFQSDKPKDDSPMKSIVSVKDVQLSNLRLRYEDMVTVIPHASMDLDELSAERLEAQVEIGKGKGAKGDRAKVYKGEGTNGVKANGCKAQDVFEVESLKAHLIATDSLVFFPTLTAKLPNSRLDLSGIEINTSAPKQEDIEVKMNMDASLQPSDIALFVPQVAGMRRKVDLTGQLSGTIDSLEFRHILLRYDKRDVLRGDVSAIGLPDLSNPYLRANLEEFQTNAAQLQDFLSQLNNRPIRLPVQVYRLGTIHYRGLAEGHLHDLTLHGAFRTALGAISTDGSFRADSLFEHMDYDARVVGRHFRLGRMIDHPKLQSLTLDVAAKGQIDHGAGQADVTAHIRQLTYDRYTYNDLHMKGYIAPKLYRGHCAIRDSHANMSFEGVVDLRDNNPEINFNLLCKHFDIEPLSRTRLATSFAMAVDLDGSTIDEISGYLKIDSLRLATANDSLMMKQLLLLVAADPSNRKTITLTSDYLRANADGTFRYADIVPAFLHLMSQRLPSAVSEPTAAWQPVNFTFSMDGDKLQDIQNLFDSSVKLSDHPSIRAKANINHHTRSDVWAQVLAPGVSFGGTSIQDVSVSLTSKIDSVLSLQVTAGALDANASLSAHAFRDTILTRIAFASEQSAYQVEDPTDFRAMQRAMMSEQRAGSYGGDLSFITHFRRYNKKPLIDVHILPGQMTIRDSLYTVDESRLTYVAADTSLAVDHFLFEGAGQHLRANGYASRRVTDTLSVDLRRIDASYVVPFILPQKTIMFNGLLTGRADITSIFGRPRVDTRIHIDDMGLNNCLFGDAEVDLHISDTLGFHADVFKPHLPSDVMVALDGKALFDKNGTWCLNMTTDSVPLNFINHWTSEVLKDLDGHATGTVVVGGEKGKVYVLVNAAAQNAHLTLPWTGARYTIPSDTIVLDSMAILFPHVHLTDVEGHPVDLTGGIYHDQFRDFRLDLHVNAREALVFDQDKEGEMLRGHVYATGHVDVTGPEDDILVFADAVTAHQSTFRLSIDQASTAYESSFVHFVSHDTLPKADKPKDEEEKYLRPAKCKVRLNLDLNPMLLFQLVLGERNGDIIQGRGTGALQLTYETSTGEVSLLGTYDLDNGTLAYTVGNVIRKDFTVGSGSTIAFSGNPENPDLNVTAKYRVVANIKDLFGEDTDQLGISRTNIPVLTCLHLSGPLNNPILSFSLEFPSSDQTIQQQVRQVINTDEMLMRQVIYLLVFGRFFTPENMSNTRAATLNSTYSLLSSTVTSQINAWLSKLTNMLTLGVAIPTEGEGAAMSREYEANFQLQPIDRLVINGNFGYRYNDISNQPFFGDLDVEVLLTEDGQWRLKGYTHTVDKYSLRQATTIQGVGFMWKKDFNWPTKKDREERAAKRKAKKAAKEEQAQ